MIILTIEILLVSLSSYFFTARFFRTRSLSEFILIWFTLFLAQIIIVELGLGVAGQLFLANVFIVHAVILLLAAVFCRPQRSPDITRPDISILLDNKLLLLAFSVFIGFAIVKVFVNLVNPPVSPDSLQYHLAFPAAWIRSGNLNNPTCIFASMPMIAPPAIEASSTSYYPINAQLFFAWLMLPLRNAFLADAGELPFYIVGMIAVFLILKKYGIKDSVALLTGFLWVLIPNIFKQLRTASQIDVICAVLFLIVFYSFLLLKEKFNLSRALFCGITLGIFLGTKIINIVWFIACLPFFAYIFYRSVRESKIDGLKLILIFANLAAMVLLFAGFTYFRNFIFTGNPLFPVDLKILGVKVFKGLVDNVTYKAMIASGDTFNLNRILFKEGLGVQYLGLTLLGALLPFVFLKQISQKIKPRLEYALLFLTPIVMLVMYAQFVNVYVIRYLFPYLSLGLIVGVIFINLLAGGEKYFFFISFVAILASAAELAHRQELIISLALSVIFFVLLIVFKKKILTFFQSRFFKFALAAFFVLVVLLLGFLNNRYNKDEFMRYPGTFSKNEAWQKDIAWGWRALNNLTGSGATVAYTGRQEFYPLFGSGLKNDVQYVSINEKEASLYNHFDGLFRKTKDFSAWRENLKKEKAEYLFIALPFLENRESPDPGKFPVEDEWAASHPGDFQLMFSNSLSRIYKILVK